jgi:cell division protein FtsZ
MVFITAGMGGGTGTGGASVVASLAKQMGILTVGVVTKPFSFEGKPRSRNAEQGIKALAEHVDSLIIIPNEKLVQNMGKNTSLTECFEKANDVLYNAVHGISDLITRPGIINVDFADVKTVMSSMGMTMMGTGIAAGEDRASEATKKAINSPLLEHVDIKGAKGILVNIIADDSLSIGEFNEIGAEIREYADPDANIVIGSSFDPDMKEEIMITLVATGVESTYNENKSREVNSGQVAHQTEHAQPRSRQEAPNYAEHLVKHSGEPQENSAPSRGGFNEPSRGFEEPRITNNEDVGNTRVVKSEQLSDQERREIYNSMKQKKKKGLGGLLGMRKSPDLSEEPSSGYSEPSDPVREERYKEEPRHGFGISAIEDDGLRAPSEERPQATRPEPVRAGVSRFLSRKG